MVHTVVYLTVGVIFALPSVLFLYGSLSRDARWPSSAVRVVAVLTDLAWLALGTAFMAAAWTSGSTSRNLVIAGASAAILCAVARWLVRDRWERRTVQGLLARNRRGE